MTNALSFPTKKSTAFSLSLTHVGHYKAAEVMTRKYKTVCKQSHVLAWVTYGALPSKHKIEQA